MDHGRWPRPCAFLSRSHKRAIYVKGQSVWPYTAKPMTNDYPAQPISCQTRIPTTQDQESLPNRTTNTSQATDRPPGYTRAKYRSTSFHTLASSHWWLFLSLFISIPGLVGFNLGHKLIWKRWPVQGCHRLDSTLFFMINRSQLRNSWRFSLIDWTVWY